MSDVLAPISKIGGEAARRPHYRINSVRFSKTSIGIEIAKIDIPFKTDLTMFFSIFGIMLLK